MKMIGVIIALCLVIGSVRADGAERVQWSGQDIKGARVEVPVADRASLVAFVRPEQEQSKQAVKQIAKLVPDGKDLQVVLVVSGPVGAERAANFAQDLPAGWLTVADPEFAAAGKLNVHVWPTTVLVRSDGTQVAHIGGLPRSFAGDLQAYLEFAAGKLDEATLKQRLASSEVVTDSPAQAASRHLQVARRMIEQGQLAGADEEITAGLKLAPDDAMLRVTRARLRVLQGNPAAAIEILDTIAAGAVPPWQIALVRGRALISLEKWVDAKALLPDALKLNPNPSEAHYLLGLCHQHDKQWELAAEQFRLAFEKSGGAGSQNLATTRNRD